MNKWDDTLTLFTPDEFDRIPDGTVLISINGDSKIKGVDYIDMDTRFGHIAWGVHDPMTHPLRELFMQFALS